MSVIVRVYLAIRKSSLIDFRFPISDSQLKAPTWNLFIKECPMLIFLRVQTEVRLNRICHWSIINCHLGGTKLKEQ